MVELRTAQKLFLEKAEETRRKGNKRGLLIFATGLGKTLSALSDALNVAKNGKILMIAHNHNLLYQHARDFKLLTKKKKIGFFYKSRKETEAEILFANIMTLKHKKYLESFKPNEFDYIIIDETHHAGAKSYQVIFDYFKPKFLLGMTATPNRSDQKTIFPLYNNNIILQIDREEAINNLWLKPYKYVFLFDRWCNYEKVKNYKLKDGFCKYDLKELGKVYSVPERDKAIVKEFKKRAGDRRGIGFCIGVQESKRMAQLFNTNGISSIAIYGKMKERKRNRILEDFENGKYQIIFNCDLIGEGLHLSEVDIVLKLRPTQSFIKDNQHTGRGLINIEGVDISESKYEKLLILDWVGNYGNAFKNYIYQGDEKDYKKKKSKDIRNIIELPIGCEVEFEARVIDLFNEQKNNSPTNLNQALEDFKKIYGNKKPFRKQLQKENRWIYNHFLINNLLDKYCKPSRYKDLNQTIAKFKKIYGNKKPFRKQLEKENGWIYNHFLRNNLLDKYCKPSRSK